MIRAALFVMAALAAPAAQAIELPWSGGEEATATAPVIRPVVSIVVADHPSQRRSFAGVVAAATEVQLGFQTLGRLSARPVDVGETVKTGALLAELAPDDLQDNVRAARAAVETAEVTQETASLTAERVRGLARRNVASTARLEQAERELKSAEAGLRQARSELARAEDAEGFARLMAPFDGVVSAVFENPGAVVGAGTPVLTLSDESTREAMIDLPEVALSTMPVGTDMTIWLEADPDTRVSGQIERVEPLADAATRTRRVHVAMDDSTSFRLNSLIRAQRAGDAGSALSVPEPALTGTGDAVAVWVIHRQDGAAQVEHRPVETGERFAGQVQILSGLSVGEEVVIRGVNSLQDGQPVGRRVRP
ncbi:RND family efflux transporter, MFP subunit [Paracoccus isoporae]|uniref:RND family efflux transporter, MFP subunit n=1 Tax=Paracoccus isoporae TaxID=591205 RepID=A0A1G6Z3N4_9RHOB|nr:efflux RND transporter periplasmic adaptor subunit [Paracoccus isoporae]SDD97228.1 RND family efflux transporter, MFP subunit [Paracoccus isoporae]